MDFWTAALIGMGLLALAAAWQGLLLGAAILLAFTAVILLIGGIIWLVANFADNAIQILSWVIGVPVLLLVGLGVPLLIADAVKKRLTGRGLGEKKEEASTADHAGKRELGDGRTRDAPPAHTPTGKIRLSERGPLGLPETLTEAR